MSGAPVRVPSAALRPVAAGDPFVTHIRTRGGVVRVDGDGPRMTVRVELAELWDTIAFDVPASLPLIALMGEALFRFGVRAAIPADYVLKLHGGEVRSVQESLAGCGARDGSTFFLALRRRRPVR